MASELQPEDRQVMLSPGHLRTLRWLGAILLVALALPVLRGGVWFAEYNQYRSTTVETGLDPNTASWAELAILPGLGEINAKRIVSYREAHARPGEPLVFRSAADLTKVRGLGERLAQRMSGYLRFEAYSDLQALPR